MAVFSSFRVNYTTPLGKRFIAHLFCSLFDKEIFYSVLKKKGELKNSSEYKGGYVYIEIGNGFGIQDIRGAVE